MPSPAPTSPSRGARSSTTTWMPSRCSAAASAMPPIPAPAMRTRPGRIGSRSPRVRTKSTRSAVHSLPNCRRLAATLPPAATFGGAGSSCSLMKHIAGSARSCPAALATCLGLPAASSAADPNFDAVNWLPLGCDTPNLITPDSPSSASFAGDHTNLPAYYGYNTDYLYFRYRMDTNPSSGSGFDQYAWTALMQVPSGDPFRYQYGLSLNGKSDKIEIWRNTLASPVKFPQFQDAPEDLLYSVPVGSLARAVPAGTSYNGGADWFVDFAFPVSTLVEQGVIASASDLAQSLFFPATQTNPNNYNKSFLNCGFQPAATLQFSKTVTPTVALPNQVTPVTYTIDVLNTGARAANGVVVVEEAWPFPAFFQNVSVQVSTDDPNATYTTAETPNGLEVKSTTLGTGRRLTVTITAVATPGCGIADFVNKASGGATNTLGLNASAPLGSDACDGVDNDCDGQVDEGTSICDDHNACTVDTCGGSTGCSHEQIPGCVPPPGGSTGTGGGTGTGTGGTGTGGGGTGTGGGSGNNGNGGGGCSGGSCSQAPGNVAEVCGDCEDNDGDGLVDYEDPDCCERIDPLPLGRVGMRMRPKAPGGSLRLRRRPSAR